MFSKRLKITKNIYKESLVEEKKIRTHRCFVLLLLLVALLSSSSTDRPRCRTCSRTLRSTCWCNTRLLRSACSWQSMGCPYTRRTRWCSRPWWPRRLRTSYIRYWPRRRTCRSLRRGCHKWPKSSSHGWPETRIGDSWYLRLICIEVYGIITSL